MFACEYTRPNFRQVDGVNMLDPKQLRQNINDVATNLARRGFVLDADLFQQLNEQRSGLQEQVQALQARRNTASKKIGQLKAQGLDADELMSEVGALNTELKNAQASLQVYQEKLNNFQMGLPNLLHADVPDGVDEANNVVLTTIGDLPQFDFDPKDHVTLGEELGDMRFDWGAKLSGARFVVLKGFVAKLHRALAQFMLNTHVNKHDYEEVYVPYLVKSHALTGTGQLPKFADDLFNVNEETDLHLIPTAEVPLTNLARESILSVEELPQKFVAHTPCFRREAGAYGKDTRGMIRQHQFDKVELVQLVTPESGEKSLDELVGHAEAILSALKLPYRKVLLCSGDTGFSATKTYDLEVWLPAQNAYREISSCSLMGDFQARRMQARFKRSQESKPELLHTLNGSGLAVGRTLVAIMENYQAADGSITIPDVLQPFFE